MSDNKDDDFIKAIFSDIKETQKEATIHQETQIINFKPAWTAEITEESLASHIDFINRQGAVVSGATSDIAIEQYPKIKANSWTGIMDFGSMKITAQTHLRETYQLGEDKTEHGFGITDLCFDMEGTNGKLIDKFYSELSAIDDKRCRQLFEDN